MVLWKGKLKKIENDLWPHNIQNRYSKESTIEKIETYKSEASSPTLDPAKIVGNAAKISTNNKIKSFIIYLF